MNDSKLIELMRNYVCPRCFHTVDECDCEEKAYYSLWWIDRNIQEHVRMLNEKGYRTLYSCESHTPQDNLYFVFSSDYGFGKTIPAPEGFKIKGSGKTIEHLYGKDSKARKKMTSEDFEAEKKEHLDILLEWIKNLPKRKTKDSLFSW